jgi:hypothetical protein
MTPQDFIAKWGAPDGIPGPAHALNEEQGAQSHFLDLCELLGVPKPGSTEGYRFEEKSSVIGGHTGYADVFMPGVFAWENKAPGKNLDTALKQLLTYSLALSNPPILVVSDRLTIRIHTRFTGHPSQTFEVRLKELDQPDKLTLLRRIWSAPESFKPKITNRDITEAAAKSFSTLAEGLRRRGAKAHDDVPTTQQRANQVAHFLTQCLFCFFAEDVGLLPGRMFERLMTNRKITSDKLTRGLSDLFTAMGGGGMFGADEIPWFNGGLFKTIDVPALSILDVTELRNAAELNWSAIDVSIFGTLFERGLDPVKRSQLGAHYTDPATILRIVEPVVQRPLLHKWELVAHTIRGLQAKNTKKYDKHYRAAHECFIEWLDQLKNFRVLDPACGSGNFLFLGLKALKDIEHRSHLEAAALGLDREADLVTGPHNVLGIELNEYAAELARMTVWIGELQWRMDHGYEFKTNPVLEQLDHIECRDALLCWPDADKLGSDPDFAKRNSGSDSNLSADSGARAEQTPGAHALRSLKSPPSSAPPTPRSDLSVRDAEHAADAGAPVEATEESGVRSEFMRNTSSEAANLVRNSALTPVSGAASERQVVEAVWPKANVVIGNPPFLGDKMMRSELGDTYTDTLRLIYKDRVPGGADLVMFWFEKARAQIEKSELGTAGLVATNSIRQRGNRPVMERIQQTTRIYEAWADMPWVNAGAAVRVSLVCFGHAEQAARLDGHDVQQLFPDLKAQATGASEMDLTTAKPLPENADASYFELCLAGPFKVPAQIATQWLRGPNVNGLPNSEVLKPIYNGSDITRRWAGNWVIDFGARMTEGDAALFEKPFEYANQHIKSVRANNREAQRSKNWWRHGRPRPELRSKLADINRYIATVETAKHRFFVFFPVSVAPEHSLIVIPRADDTTFGLLSSRMHVVWALARGGTLEDRPRYNSLAAFEPFPFPAGLTPADTAHQQTEPVADGALIPAHISEANRPLAQVQRAQAAINNVANSATPAKAPEAGVVRMSGPISKSEAYEAPASEPAPPSAHQQALRQQAIRIATAAKKLNDLREAWLNPPEWTHKVPEVTPLGMTQSPYPDRIEPKPGISEQDLKALQKRTLTNLYNARPAWLGMAHSQLDAAVAAAYGWTDYTPDMPDEEILKRLLALNLERSATVQQE